MINKSNKKFQQDKLKNSVNKWKFAMTQYIAVAEKEYAKINNLIQSSKSTMTDQETKAATRLLGKKIIFYILFDLIYF